MPGLLALIEGALPSGRYRARRARRAGAMSALAFAASASRRTSRRGARPRRDEVGCSWPARATAALVHARFRDLADVPRAPATCSSSTRRRRCPPRSPAASRRRLSARTSRPRASDGRWVVELRARDARRFAAPAAGDASRCPGGGSAELLAPYRGSGRLVGRRLDLPARCATTSPRHGRPIRYAHVRADWPLEAYQTVFATSPAAPRCRAPARPFTPELVDRARGRGVLVAPLMLHTGVSSLEARRAARTPSATGCPPRPPGWSTPCAAGRPRDRGRARRSCAPWRPSPTRTARAPRRRAGPSLVDHARARRARGRRPDHRLARARGLAPADARGGRPAASCSSAPTPRADAAATSGTSSATAT